jgi:hypothetical protein
MVDNSKFLSHKITVKGRKLKGLLQKIIKKKIPFAVAIQTAICWPVRSFPN